MFHGFFLCIGLLGGASTGANDQCDSATLVPCDGTPISADNSFATSSLTDPLFDCSSIPVAGNGTIWFRFTATSEAVRIVSTPDGTLEDGGLLSLLEGSCDAMVPLRCSTLVPSQPTELLSSGLIVGEEYYVELASALTSPLLGPRTLTVECIAAPSQPNDGCDGSVTISPGQILSFDTFGATSASPGCDADGLRNNVWFTVVGNGQSLIATAESNDIESLELRVYRGDCADAICVAESTTTFGPPRVEWISQDGVPYRVAIGSQGHDDEGAGEVSMATTIGGGPPCQENAFSFYCVATGGANAPNIAGLGCATAGGTLRVRVQDATPNSPGCIGFSTGQLQAPLFDGTLCIVPQLNIPRWVPASGTFVQEIAVPIGFADTTVYAQAFVFNMQASSNLEMSLGLAIDID